MKTIEVVAAIIMNDNKILTTRRGYGECMNMWEFPGGKMELEETKEEALIREIKEELELDIEVSQFITTVDYDYPNFHLKMHCFWCEVISGNLVLKEHEAAKWLGKEDIDTVAWLPADLEIVEIIKRAV